MAIDPTSDLILDVIRAGDPERAAAAASRLAAIANASGAASGDFGAELGKTASPASASLTAEAVADAGGARGRLAATASQSDPATKAKVEFEAMLLNSFVGQMLPKDCQAVFGQGMAGEMWKSMLADQVSRQIAKSGVLGIGDRLFATHALPARPLDAQRGQPASAEAVAAAQASVNPLSVGAADSVVGGVVVAPASKST